MRIRPVPAALLLVVATAGCARTATPAPGATTARGDTLVPPDSGFTMRRLAAGVHAVIRREPPAVINESNSLFIVGDEDVVVVDAQSSTARTREVIAALRAITSKPVRALVHTHWHDDHVAGNGAWRAAYPGLEIIAHETAAADLPTEGARLRLGAMRARTGTIALLRGFVERGTSYLGGPLSAEERASHLAAARLMADYSDADSLLAPLLPTRTVGDRLVLTQGHRTIELLHVGRGHTRGDLVVHLPRERIVATGDLVMAPITFVGSTSFPLDFGTTVDRVRALGARQLVPGHGPVLDGDAHAARVSRLLHDLAAQATASVARGESLAQARGSVRLDAHRDALAGASPVRRILFSYYVAGAGVQRAHEQAAEARGMRERAAPDTTIGAARVRARP